MWQELQAQKSVPARFELEPAMVQLSIMADVYMDSWLMALLCLCCASVSHMMRPSHSDTDSVRLATCSPRCLEKEVFGLAIEAFKG